jgi:N-acylneuraminate cytidylyltransferase
MHQQVYNGDMMNLFKKPVVAVIPARAGSKRIKNKNIKKIGGLPLFMHSINHALQVPEITHVILSSDDPFYEEVLRQFHGPTKVDFLLRPKGISGDHATDLECFEHVCDFVESRSFQQLPEFFVHLRPTSPVRRMVDTRNMIQILRNDKTFSSARTIQKTSKTPFKMFFLDKNNLMNPVVFGFSKSKEPWNLPDQILPETWQINGNTDIIRFETIANHRSMTGETMFGYRQEWYPIDIDTEEDWEEAEAFFKSLPNLFKMSGK